MKKIPENVMMVLRAILPLLAVIILFIILAQIGWGKIADIRAKITEAKSEQAVLTQKLELLRTVSVNGATDSNIATNALPASNAALAVISQIRNLAVNFGLVVTNVKSTAMVNDSDDVSDTAISFNILGEKSKVLSFLGGINTFAPISMVDTIRLTEQDANYSGEITIKSFWSPLPTKLPASIEEFQDLTNDDKETLANIGSLTQPTFVNLPPSNQAGRTDPFSL